MKLNKLFCLILIFVGVNFSQTVNLVSPIDNAIHEPQTPILEWSTADFSTITKNVVRIYSNPGLTTLVHQSGDLLGTAVEYNVPSGALVYNRKYYWIVETTGEDALSNPVVVTSASRPFTTLLATPVLSSPANNYISDIENPTFAWNMSNRRSNVKYELLIGNSPGLTSPADVNTSTIVNPSPLNITSLGLENAKKYFWNINALVSDAAAANNGESKLATSERVFYTPLNILATPYNGETGLTIEPTFTWSDVDYEDGYRFKLSASGTDQADFDANLIYALNISSTNVTFHENSGGGTFPLNHNTKYYWQVVAKDGAVNVNSPIWHFTTYPEVIVEQYYPAIDDLVYTSDVMFTYGINAGTNNLKFKVQVIASANPPANWYTPDFQAITSNLFHTFNNLAGGTKFYWRVILLNNNERVLAYSNVRHFTTAGGATVPIPSWPVSNATLYTLTPTFYWYLNGFGSNLTYDLEIKTVNDELTPALHFEDNLANMFYTLPSGIIEGSNTYYWRVRSVYKRGDPVNEVTSAYSAWEQFTTNGIPTVVVPVPSYPVGGLDVYTTAPTLYWYLGQYATGLDYIVKYGTDPALPDPQPNTINTTAGNTFLTISGLTPGATYYWAVKSKNGALTSAWSDIVSFKVVGGVGESYPVATWPLNNPTLYTTKPTLNWYLEGSTLGITGYVIKLKKDTEPVDWSVEPVYASINNVHTTNYTFTTELEYGAKYYWAVYATNGVALSTPSTGSFTIVGGAGSGDVVLNYPIGNDFVYTVTPMFSWYFNGSTFALDDYELVYSYSDVFFPAATTTVPGITATSYIPTTGLTSGATYFWKVRARFGANYSSFSPVGVFVVNPGSSAPITPIIGGPNNVSIGTSSPVVSWVALTGNQNLKYELEYSSNPSFSNSVIVNNISSTHQVISGLNSNTPYFWRVRSKDTQGNYSYFSGMGQFKVIEGVTGIDLSSLPTEFSVSQNYPNPFNPVTTIRVELPSSGLVSLKVYDVLGNEVANLLNEVKDAGSYPISIDGSKLATGVYIYKVSFNGVQISNKMVLIK